MNILDVPAALKKHFSIHEHMLIDKFTHRGWDVYISEGGPYFSKKYEGGNPDFSYGWYESAYAVHSGEQFFYQPMAFDYLHDIRETKPARKLGRMNAAINRAKEHIDEAIELESH